MILLALPALVAHYWIYLAVALAVGAVAGWITADTERA